MVEAEAEYLPETQLTHALEEAAPLLAKEVPAAQLVQAVEPTTAAKEPAGHGAHDALEVIPDKAP